MLKNVGRTIGVIASIITIVTGLLYVADRRRSSEPPPMLDQPSPEPSSPSEPPPSSRPEATSGAPQSGPVLPYEADWRNGAGGWAESEGWNVVGGQLTNDGSSYYETMTTVAPVDLEGLSDYAVEADIQLLRYSGEGAPGLASFGVVFRSTGSGDGYGAGHCVSAGIFSCVSQQTGQYVGVLRTAESDPEEIASAPFRPKDALHTYRVEVRDNTITFKVDDALIASATDNRFLSGGRVGLWSYRSQVSVKGFRVSAL